MLDLKLRILRFLSFDAAALTLCDQALTLVERYSQVSSKYAISKAAVFFSDIINLLKLHILGQLIQSFPTADG